MRKNLIKYNGRHDTTVIIDTFHAKSYDQMNSQSEEKKKKKGMKKTIQKSPLNLVAFRKTKHSPKYSWNTIKETK